ncbi:MAG: tRNA (adenosine(37)-N6)-threonylcarbamoyltransferase complex dimerization subunit type 1 TsaB [Rhodospirillales bacterium]|nr:tRNA (adenosine(37)-N6)-threonylcarbamoyltransferase complex dimerization subunit type 1 TsaB [Rhodospirillales bacterium]
MILSFDCAMNGCAVGVYDHAGNRVLASLSEEMTSGQAERLVPMIEQVLKQGKKQYADLEAVAVTNGPGAFTGIRIGIAAAKALALTLEIPAIGISTFDAVLQSSLQSRPAKSYKSYLIILETKRSDFYVRKYDADLVPVHAGACLAAEQVSNLITEEKTVLIGDAVKRFMQESNRKPEAFECVDIKLCDPVAIAKQASIQVEQPENIIEIAPAYFRAPDVSTPKTPERYFYNKA